MAEWLYEDGIGEERAILVEDGRILEAVIELAGELRAGSVVSGRLAAILIPGRRGLVSLSSGAEVLVEPLPRALAEGAAVKVEIVREALAEQGRRKAARGRITDREEGDAPSLLERFRDRGVKVVASGGRPDPFEQAGWSELLEEAMSGEIVFAGGALRMSLTPAMTLFDVDGALPPAALAVAGAEAAGRTIRRFGIGGSIGIDLPTLPAKADRQTAAAALDAVLPQPFERTAVNGFGFLQIVRRRERASVPELLQGDLIGAAARAVLRHAERAAGQGPRIVTASPLVVERIAANPDWLQALERRIGVGVELRAAPGLAISAGHVHSQFP